MNYAQIRKFDTANGVGIRSSLFVSGCTHGCPGCFNRDYQHFKYGHAWTKEVEDDFIKHLKNPNVAGVTILGGEPMDQVRDNDSVSYTHLDVYKRQVKNLLRIIRKRYLKLLKKLIVLICMEEQILQLEK